jgi:hypothetical protein
VIDEKKKKSFSNVYLFVHCIRQFSAVSVFASEGCDSVLVRAYSPDSIISFALIYMI